MAKKTVVFINKNGNNVGDAIALGGVKPVKIKAQAGVKYLLKDAGDIAPENATLTRVGDDLHVTLEGESSPALVLEGYFGLTEPAGIYGVAEDGQLYAYGRTDGGDIFSLADGESSAIALAGDPVARGSDGEDDNFVFWPLLLAGGLAAAGFSAVSNGGGSSKNFALPEANEVPSPAKAWVSNSIEGTIDDVGAVTGPIANGEATDDMRPEFNGVGKPGSTIVIEDNGRPIGSAKVDEDGNWSFTPEVDLGEGGHSIVIIETDKGGNQGTPSAPIEIIVDTIAPNKPELGEGAIDDVGAVTGPVAAGDTTDDTRPEFNGSGEAGSTIVIEDKGQVIGTAKVDEDGRWSFTPEVDLGEGDHSIVIIETDKAGNKSEPSDPYEFTVDTTAPGKPGLGEGEGLEGAIDDVGAVTGPVTPGGETDDTRPEFKGNGDAGSTIVIEDNGQPIGTVKVGEDGKWSFTPDVDLGEGGHSIVIIETDKAGNKSEPSDPYEFTVDTTAPDTPELGEGAIDDVGAVTGPIAPGGETDDTRPEFNGTGDAGSTIVIEDNGQPIGTAIVGDDGKWSFTPEEDLGEGEHSIVIIETDKDGNVSEPSDPYEFTVDTTAPNKPEFGEDFLGGLDDVGAVTGPIAPGGETDDTRPEFKGIGEVGSTIVIEDNGQAIGTAIVDKDGNWSFTPEEDLGEGEHSIVIIETDRAGNTSEPSDPYEFTVDTTAPNKPGFGEDFLGGNDDVPAITGPIANDGVTNDTRPEFNGSGEAGSKIVIEDNGQPIGTAIVDKDGNWSFTPEEDLGEGEHSIVIIETDKAGNTSEPSDPYEFTVDTQAPGALDETLLDLQDNVGAITGQIARAGVTDDTVPTFSGKAPAGATTINVYDNGVLIGSTAVDASSGNWTFEPLPALSGTAHNLQAAGVDEAGNVGPKTAGWAFDLSADVPDVSGLTSNFSISTDTWHGFGPSGRTPDATNTDLVTRDSTLTLSGVLSKNLAPGQTLQISKDGIDWEAVSLDGTNWSYSIPAEFQASTTETYQLRVANTAGVGSVFFTNGTVNVDLAAPDQVIGKPVVNANSTSATALHFDSVALGNVEKNAVVALIDDVDGDGAYTEGVDEILGYTTASATGTWSIDQTLAKGAYNLGFVVFDAAGNASQMSATTSVGVNDTTPTLQATNWGGGLRGDWGTMTSAMTMTKDGQYVFFQPDGKGYTSNNPYGAHFYTVSGENGGLDGTALDLKDGRPAGNGAANERNSYWVGAQFGDIDRDGDMDMVVNPSNANGTLGVIYRNQGDGTYITENFDRGDRTHMGSVLLYDKEGDGFLDLVYANSETGSMDFIVNDGAGNLSAVNGTGRPIDSATGKAFTTDHNFQRGASAVDYDGDGKVDIVAHVGLNNGSKALGLFSDYTSANGGTYTYQELGQIARSDGTDFDYGNTEPNYTWADFDGDGKLDLFMSRGATLTGGVGNAYGSDESRIYWQNATTGALDTSNPYRMNDSLSGTISFAVDWNMDGLIDVIEMPKDVPAENGYTGAEQTVIQAWINGGGRSFSGLVLATGVADATGGIVADVNWDGSQDVVVYTSDVSKLLANNNVAADGTSLHLHIADQNGINAFYGNQVELYNSKGVRVATQVINPQNGQGNVTTGIVDFYGLDPNETYSAKLIRVSNGVSNNVDGAANETWGGLKAGAANTAINLTAEKTGDVNNSTQGGTGYNDVFYTSAGDDTFNGGGGWTRNLGQGSTWVEDGGQDFVNYSRATGAIVADLGTGVATGNGNDKLINIEGLIGSQFADMFTSKAGADSFFEGRGGNDVFNLAAGGHNTLIYNRINAADTTGGNGQDTVNGFVIGDVTTNTNADIVDMSGLFAGLNLSTPTGYTDSDGSFKLDSASSSIRDYLKVESDGVNTKIYVDIDGGGNSFTQLTTLNGVNTTLEELVKNHQIKVASAGGEMSVTTFDAEVNWDVGSDDVVHIANLDFDSVDGASGIDTLVLDGAAMHIDLSALGMKVQGFEKFDLGTGGNTLTLGAKDVLANGQTDLGLADGKKQMVINGANGEVDLLGGDGWASEGATQVDGVTYNVYTNLAGTSELLVEDKVHVTIL